jgi:tetratricopeptide (TPR) repeat protein
MTMALALACLHGCNIDHDPEKACNELLIKSAACSAQKDFAQAQKILTEAQSEADKSGHSWQKARVLREIASTYSAAGDEKNAEITARSLIQMYDQTPVEGLSRAKLTDLAEDRTRARILLAQSLTKQKRPDEAVSILAQAKDDMARNFGPFELQLDLDARYLEALRATGKSTEIAKEDFESTSLGDSESRDARTYANRLLSQGQKSKAIEEFKKAKQLATAAKSEPATAESSIDLAAAEYLAMDLPAARAELADLSNTGLLDRVDKRYKARFLTVKALTASSESEQIRDFAAAEQISKLAALVQLGTVRSPGMDLETRKFVLKTSNAICSMSARTTQLWRMYEYCSLQKAARQPTLQFLLQRANDPAIALEERARCMEIAADVLSLDHQDTEAKKRIRQALLLRAGLKDSDTKDKLTAEVCRSADYLHLGDAKTAIKIAESTLACAVPDASNPDYNVNIASLHFWAGAAYFADHQYAKAVASYDKAIELFRPKNAVTRTILMQRDEAAARLKKEQGTKQ